MSNEVATKSSSAVAALAGLKQGMQNVRQALPTSSTVPILRMGKDGIWIYGQENIEYEELSRWAVNPMSIMHGYVCWTNKPTGEGKNELLGEVYAPMTSAPIDPSTLPDKGWPWKAATTVQLKCVSGEDIGAEVIYKPSSLGGADVMQKLLTEIEKMLDTGTEKIVPVVTLGDSHYMHKQYGKTYTPVFKIVDWLDMDGATGEEAEGDEPEGDDEPDEKPKKSGKKAGKKKEPETEPEQEQETEQEPETETEDEPKTEGRTRRRRRPE